jgi:hypothetical protein
VRSFLKLAQIKKELSGKLQAPSSKQQAARPEGPSKIVKNKKTFDIPHSP